MLPPVFVMRQGDDLRLWVHVPDGRPARAWVVTEDGQRHDLDQMDYWVEPVDVDGVRIGEASFRMPGDLPLGWHTVHAESDGTAAHAPVVVAPRRLDPDAIAGDRQWGFMTQVYAMRSTSSWGMGDLHDLADLAAWSGRDLGAGFVLINPLHAASPVPPMAPSPVPAGDAAVRQPHVPAHRGHPRVRPARSCRRRPHRAAGGSSCAAWTRRPTCSTGTPCGVRSARRSRRSTRSGLDADRASAYAAFREAEGAGLRDFATWCAISDVHGADGRVAGRPRAPGRPGRRGLP